jgi:hypothetical protein
MTNINNSNSNYTTICKINLIYKKNYLDCRPIF